MGKMILVTGYRRENFGERFDCICQALARLAENNDVQIAGLDNALGKADIVVLLVDHKPFRVIDRDNLQQKIVIDTRGIWH